MAEPDLHPSFFPATSRGLVLGPREIHLWAIPLTCDPRPYELLLSDAERSRASRLHVRDHQRRFSISHGAMRSILADYVDSDPRGLEFRVGPRGKPYLRDHKELFFNLSHSSQIALLALAPAEVGVDLERIRPLENLADIAARQFSAAECARIRELEGEARLRGFYRVWTCKEAFIKALGGGFSIPLDAFDVAVEGAHAILSFRDRDDDPGDWTMADVAPAADYAAALAIRGSGFAIRRFRAVEI
ncbi:MAG: 4'-phosphopantetheinyl transferase superfamily protein [Planctomycetota bacterium]